MSPPEGTSLLCGSQYGIAAAPGMVLGRMPGFSCHLFGGDHFCLVFLLLEDGVGEFITLIENADLALIILTNRHLGLMERIRRTIGLDLIDHVLELEGEVFGYKPGLLPGEDLVEVLMSLHRSMSIQGRARLDRKAGIEIGDELRQIGIALLHIVDPA